MGVFVRDLGLAAACVILLGACVGEPALTEDAPDDAMVTASPSTPSASPTPTSSPTPSPTPTPVAFHDFSAIEGDWEGIATEGAAGAVEIRIVASIKSGGAKNDIVGEAFVFDPPTATEPVCRVAWLADAAAPPMYQVREVAGPGCVSGSVELVHDPEADTLRYQFASNDGNPAFAARGTLERSDS